MYISWKIFEFRNCNISGSASEMSASQPTRDWRKQASIIHLDDVNNIQMRILRYINNITTDAFVKSIHFILCKSVVLGTLRVIIIYKSRDIGSIELNTYRHRI